MFLIFIICLVFSTLLSPNRRTNVGYFSYGFYSLCNQQSIFVKLLQTVSFSRSNSCFPRPFHTVLEFYMYLILYSFVPTYILMTAPFKELFSTYNCYFSVSKNLYLNRENSRGAVKIYLKKLLSVTLQHFDGPDLSQQSISFPLIPRFNVIIAFQLFSLRMSSFVIVEQTSFVCSLRPVLDLPLRLLP